MAPLVRALLLGWALLGAAAAQEAGGPGHDAPVARAPADESVKNGFELAGGLLGPDQIAVGTVRDGIEAIDDPQVKVDLLVKMARWYGTELNHHEYAVASVQQALALDEDNVPALNALAGFYRNAGQWQELAQTLTKVVGLEDDPDKKIETLSSLAELYEDVLQAPPQAVAAYKQVLDIMPERADVRRALATSYHKLGRANDALGEFRSALKLQHEQQDGLGILETMEQMLELDGDNVADRVRQSL